MKAHMERMVRGMAWADREMFASLTACAAAWDEAQKIASHVVAAEETWLARLEARPSRVNVWPLLSLDECKSLADQSAAGYAAYLAARNDGELRERVTYRNQRGEQFTTRVVDIVTHVVIHGAYHRGQVARIVARAGGQPAATDFIAFARTVEPA